MQNLTVARPAPVRAPTTTRTEAGVVLLATGLAVLGWAAATMAGIGLQVRSGSGTRGIGLATVVITTVVVATAAAGLLRLLERRTARGLRTWTIAATAVWAVSFAGPLSATTLSAGLVLGGLHGIVGAVVVVGLRRSRVA
jgi:predicted cation transporter